MTDSSLREEDIRSTVRTFILEEFLVGEDPTALTDTTSLIRGGILDSISSMRLINHLEQSFNIVLSQEDVTIDNLDTVDRVVRVVQAKL